MTISTEYGLTTERGTAVALTGGQCRIGVARAKLPTTPDVPMAGYGWTSHAGHCIGDHLWARALYLEGGGEVAALVFLDLMSGSRHLWWEAARLLAPEGILPRQLMLAGTHTHTAPGCFYGNRFYDLFAQAVTLRDGGFRHEQAAGFADTIAQAVRNAKAAAFDGRLVVAQQTLWGASRNRSLKPFAANLSNWHGPGQPGHGLPTLLALTPQQAAIDPRVTVLTALSGTSVVGAFATFGCHATALGPRHATYARDWPGHAVGRAAERLTEVGTGAIPVIGVAASALGDASPLPPEDPEPADALPQSPALARAVGAAVGNAIVDAVEAARAGSFPAPLDLEIEHDRWSPGDWSFGWPVLAGAEDGRTPMARACPALLHEEMPDPGGDPTHPQHPKRPALGFIQDAIGEHLAIADWHPLHRLRLGDHVLVSVPGEPSAQGAFSLASAVQHRMGASSASVLACCGDYAGYYTTEPEYALQHYEGAHTLFGRATLASLEAAHCRQAGALLVEPDAPAHSDLIFAEQTTRLLLRFRRFLERTPEALRDDADGTVLLWAGDAARPRLRAGKRTLAPSAMSRVQTAFGELWVARFPSGEANGEKLALGSRLRRRWRRVIHS